MLLLQRDGHHGDDKRESAWDYSRGGGGFRGGGGGLAQIPGSDAPVIADLQTFMIIAIDEYQVKLTKTAAADLTFVATAAGRGLSQLLVGWIPGFGNAINATTAAAFTEAVRWAADSYFDESDESDDPDETPKKAERFDD